MQRRSFTTTVGTIALAGAVTLTGCSSTDVKKPNASSSSISPVQRLEAVKKVVDTAAGLHLEVTSAQVPSSVSGLLSGSGDGSHAPAFKGDLTVQIAGASAKVPVVALDGKVYAKLPIAPVFTVVDPSTFGAPDPAVLFSTGPDGLTSLLPKTQAAKLGAQQRNGAETVDVISGTLPSSAIRKVLGFGKDATGLNYDVEYQVSATNELRQVKMTGPFFQAGGKTSYVLALTKYGTKVNVTKP